MYHTLEVTILNAENLHVSKNSIKKNAFVSLWSDSSSTNENHYSTKENSDEYGGGNRISWNEKKLVIEVPLKRLIIADVKYKTSWRNIKCVGMTRIPVSDLYVQNKEVRLLSYRLWDNKVRRNRIINISVTVIAVECSFAMTGIPISDNSSTAIVTGIPVWLSNFQRNC